MCQNRQLILNQIKFTNQSMKIKDKFIKQKQLTDRPQAALRNTDSTPLLTRLQKQYLFNQQIPQKTSRDHYARVDKENLANMVNSVPANNEYLSHNVIKIDNYEGKRFKTQQGFEPMMTKSRYMVEKEEADQAPESAAVYKSSEHIVLRRNKIKKMDEKVYESIDLTENDRPLTFGLVRKTEPMQSSVEYKEDVRLKNEVLDELSSLRRSQETLNGSKDYSAISFENVPRCINHNNKKAKYRLSADNEARQEQEMIYCSKCAINLLQQGFKVDEIKPNMIASKKMAKSQNHLINSQYMISSTGGPPSRIQEMRNFQQKLNDAQTKINKSLEQSSTSTNIEEIEIQAWQTSKIYDQLISHLQKMKEVELTELNQKKQKKTHNLQRYQREMNQQLDSIRQMKKQMKEFRNKFVIMKQSEFQFLISSFLNKIQLYGNQFKETETPIRAVEDHTNQIMIDLCEFCKTVKGTEDSRISAFEKKNEIKTHHQQSEDEFICKEIKGPFRTLFPQDDIILQKNADDSPSFNNKKSKPMPLPMQRSIRNNEMMKNNQYY